MISNIKIKNFRNIRDADVDFGNINILTGKNSCGKSNLLDLIKAFPSTWDENVYDRFGGNIVSEGPGIAQTNICFEFSYTSNVENTHAVLVTENNETYMYYSQVKKKSIQKSIEKNGEIKSFNANLYGLFHRYKHKKGDAPMNPNQLVAKEKESLNIIIPLSDEDSIISSPLEIVNSIVLKKSKPTAEFPILSNSVKEFNNLQKFFIDSFNIKNIEETVERIKKKTKNITHFRDFNDSNLYYLLADIQSDTEVFTKYKKMTSLYTNNIITSFSINTSGKGVRQGHFNIESPNGSKLFSSLSMGTLIMLYVITLKSWLTLGKEKQTFQVPTYLIFDEIDSYLHPDLIENFTEVLKLISEKLQIFFASHSPLFLDQFKKKDIYILQDSEKNKSNIMNYQSVMNQLPEEIQLEFKDSPPSELFREGYIDNFIPLK